MWAVFLGVVAALLILDLGVLHKKDHAIGIRESLKYSAWYVFIGLSFGGWVWYTLGQASAQLYWTGYIVEKTLSIDNIFVISLVFIFFAVPRIYQHRVLFWGILGVIVLRGLMIGIGAELVSRFHWVLYLFAAFLIFTGIKMLFSSDEDHPDIAKNPVVRLAKRHMPITTELHGHKFALIMNNKIWFTPLLLTLMVVECVDIVFAVDSVPAILALTTDTYIVYTSNIFAILGLRALYFALDAILHRFKYLKYALAVVLVFIGSKIFIIDILDLEKFPPALSLGIVVAILASGILYSLRKTHGHVVADK
ncbi:MAG: TerC family protein [Alphaproteobacteria bacterium]|nr:TerC family protein [Alphaproteobacteria bacterium]